jgi:hypothetical protein
MGGVNRPPDVTTVQELLNNVPTGSGGPVPPLAVDGLCGPKTIGAIQRFQRHHFGWPGTDGRVDPGGPTLHKLNEYDTRGVPNPFPPLTMASTMICPHGGRITAVASSAPTASGGPPRLRASDTFIIAGCPFIMGGMPSPCMSVQWMSGPTDPLDRRSVGLCFSAAHVPQGPVVIVSV